MKSTQGFTFGLTLAAASFLVLSGAMVAHASPDPVALRLDRGPQTGNGSAARIIQRGDNNQATVEQIGDGNRGRIVQIGDGLSAILQQDGGQRSNIIQVNRGRASVNIQTGPDALRPSRHGR
jgi:hypothetical protein